MAAVSASASSSPDHGSSEVTTLLGRGSEFEGKLSFEGTVRIDGKLAGEIFSDDVLIVGEGAEVSAEITSAPSSSRGPSTGTSRPSGQSRSGRRGGCAATSPRPRCSSKRV